MSDPSEPWTFDDSDPRSPSDPTDGGVAWSKWGGLLGLYLVALVFVSTVGITMTQLVGHLQTGILATQVVGIAGAALLYSELRGEDRAPWPDTRRLGLSPGELVIAGFGIVALGLAANAVMALEVHWFPVLESQAERYQTYINALIIEATGLDRLLGFAAICLAAPLCEELLFRGTFLPEQRRFSTTTAAVVANGILFAAFHQNPISLVPLSFVGAFLAHLVVLSESIWSAILAHAILNGFNGLLVPELLPGADSPEVALSQTQLLGSLALFGAVGGACWWWLAHSVSATPDERPEQEDV